MGDMAAKPKDIPVKDRLSALASAYPNIRKIILFGSFARGTETRHSDVDLIIVMDTEKRFFDRYDGIHGEVLRLLKPYSVEFFIYTPDEFERMRSGGNPFIRRALKEGIVAYERRKA